MTYDFRLGRWQEREAETVDCIICDPPYSARTHSGNEGMRSRFGGAARRDIDYHAMTPRMVFDFVWFAAHHCRGWIAAMTDHELIPHWEEAYTLAGLYAFAPVPIIQPRVRLVGDGPASCAVYLMVARPRKRAFLSWGALPGWYAAGIDRDGRQGGKPIGLMAEIVRDYSREGDTVYDPFAGHATTGVAALQLGRHFVGDECDAGAHAAGLARLRRVVAQPSLFEAKTKTGSLFDSP